MPRRVVTASNDGGNLCRCITDPCTISISNFCVKLCVVLTNSVARRTQGNWRYWRILDREILDRPSLTDIFPSSAFGRLPRIRFLNISVNTEGDDLIWEPFYAVCDSVKKRQSFENRKNRSKYNFFKAKRGNNYCETIRTLFVIYSDRSTEI